MAATQRKLRFNVKYDTRPGETIVVFHNKNAQGDLDRTKPFYLNYVVGGHWENTLSVTTSDESFTYEYALLEGRTVVPEGGKPRVIPLQRLHDGLVDIWDHWKPAQAPEVGFLNTSLFTEIFARPSVPVESKPAMKAADVRMLFRVNAAFIEPSQVLSVSGSIPQLGSWDVTKTVPLTFDGSDFVGDVAVPRDTPFVEFKYLVRAADGKVLRWEEGANHRISVSKANPAMATATSPEVANTIMTWSIFRRSDYTWKAAGLAVPIFSLRSKNSMGVGEFLDLKPLVDLSNKMGIKIIQILPLNDTSVTGTWVDSYPYSALSVMALHPLYLNIEAATSDAKIKAKAVTEASKLNSLSTVDYEAVMAAKNALIDEIIAAEGVATFRSEHFAKWKAQSASWLPAYAAYLHLRKEHKTNDFSLWPAKFRVCSKELIGALEREYTKEFDRTYWIQYQLHVQLTEAVQYAKKHHVGVKGDLPIGVNPKSCDVWVAPQFFNLGTQSGAPPDIFSDDGQNWGFPTYNWEEMEKDGYSWWKARLRQMALYFQAFRIDHILGFFRIWSVPKTASSGLMGHFYPSIPINREELTRHGIWDFNRLVNPYVTYELLRAGFGDNIQQVANFFFTDIGHGRYAFKETFDTERKLLDFFAAQGSKPLLNGVSIDLAKTVLLRLVKNVVLLPDEHDPRNKFYPRINVDKTSSYQELDGHSKYHIWELYLDYFFRRQEDLWYRIGMSRLPMIKQASDMLVCGEDLGMVPKCVEPVMTKLSILGLRVQRMPPDPKQLFGIPSKYEYMTVCSYSSHDSSTLRGWWEEDRNVSQRFFNEVLNLPGTAPFYCEPWVCQKVMEQHLKSPSLLAIFPLQEFFALFQHLRVPDPKTEQINVPAIAQHYWRYRIHVSLEELIKDKDFCEGSLKLIKESGRV